jgi:hypothetical protein
LMNIGTDGRQSLGEFWSGESIDRQAFMVQPL